MKTYTRQTRALGVVAISLLSFLTASARADTPKFPGRGRAELTRIDPVSLLVNYVSASSKPVSGRLRELKYEAPNLNLSKSLIGILVHPCERGDRIEVSNSRFTGATRGVDAAGIGRFVWVLNGIYSSTGATWAFDGTLRPAEDVYDFDADSKGSRSLAAEVSTRLGAMLPGRPFRITIVGSIRVSVSGVCGLSAPGTMIARTEKPTSRFSPTLASFPNMPRRLAQAQAQAQGGTPLISHGLGSFRLRTWAIGMVSNETLLR